MRAEGLDVLCGGLRKSTLQFFIKIRKNFQLYFFLFFGHQTPDPEPHPYPDSLEMLDLDPDSMYPDPQHYLSH